MRRPELVLLLALGACATQAPSAVRLDGAETRGNSDRPLVAAAVVHSAGATPSMELRTSDGQLFAGQLQRADQPSVLPLAATGAPQPGETTMVGTLSSGADVLDCRFVLLNAARGMDGGGSGRCENPSRRIDFRF